MSTALHRIEASEHSDPLAIAAQWREEAEAAGDPNAGSFVLATVTPAGQPTARVLLFKGWTRRGFRFFTNYRSPKARDLTANPRAAAVFFFPLLERQVRVEGVCERLAPSDSDAYFAARPQASQLGAWASEQSHPIESLEQVRQRMKALSARLSSDWKEGVPRPPHWGGYEFVALRIELWIAGPARLNERVLFARRYPRGDAGSETAWRATRLAP